MDDLELAVLTGVVALIVIYTVRWYTDPVSTRYSSWHISASCELTAINHSYTRSPQSAGRPSQACPTSARGVRSGTSGPSWRKGTGRYVSHVFHPSDP